MSEEKLTIEEIIAHCERVTKNYEMYGNKSMDDISNFHAKEYWEHRQVKGYLEELQKYREIGTVKECCTAVEKQEKRKPIKIDEKMVCPHCGAALINMGYAYDYCDICGQKLDWGGKEWE